MIDLTIGFDNKRLNDIYKRCSGFSCDRVDKAITSAAFRAADTAKAETKRRLTERYTLPSSEIAGTLSTEGADTGAALHISSSPSALPKFKGTSPKKPAKKPKAVTSEIKKGSARSLPTDFVAVMQSGHVGVFQRESGTRMKSPYQRAGKSKWGRNAARHGRETLRQEFGPATVGMFKANEEVNEAVMIKTQEALEKRVEHEVGRLLNGSAH